MAQQHSLFIREIFNLKGYQNKFELKNEIKMTYEK